MFKITLYKDNTITNEAQFSTEAELNSWKDYHESIGTFILTEKTEVTKDFEGNDIVTVKPITHTFQISDISAEVAAEAARQAKIEAGAKAREICQKVLDYVAGANLDRELTIEQITEMQTIFKSAEGALRAGRPTYAKAFISAIEPDDVLVPAEIKNTCLELLKDY